jgi:hypothetical protein
MAKSRDFSRPYFKTRGRMTENITGSDIPAEFRSVLRPRRAKSDLRRDAEQAVKEFMAKKKPACQQTSRPVDIPPPWDDDV